MIETDLPIGTPHLYFYGMATKLTGGSLPEIVSVPTTNIDFCEYERPYVNTVFGSTTTDWWKNDLTRFTFKRYITTDTVAIKLYKDNVLVANLNDNTYGTFTNGFTSGTAEQQLYVNYLLDWKLVFNAFGWGYYQVKADLNIIGVASTFTSIDYRLLEYSDVRANKTVRIETTMNGEINGSIFDFTGLELYSSYRIQGDFIETTEKIEIKKYKTSFEKWRQIQDKVIENYELRTKMLPRILTSALTKEISLANDILVTDYKILAEEIYRRIPVYVVSFDKKQLENNRKSIYNIKFTNKNENFVKRNN